MNKRIPLPDIEDIRKDFPILKRKINGFPLVYFDNAATTQKPVQVIKAISDYYLNHNANVHRGVHSLSDEATHLHEESRKTVAEFIGAKPEELVFTMGATDSLNAVATGIESQINAGDEIVTFISEHHSNFVPWQKVCERKGANLKVADFLTPEASIKPLLSEKTKVVALSQASNVLSMVFPIMRICEFIKNYNRDILIVVDGAQSVPHMPVNVQKLGCDFLAFSGHKMLGPMGIGCLWIKKEAQELVEPWKFGGGMIREVLLSKSTWVEGPQRFEAGTPNVAGAVGLARAIKYLQDVGMENVQSHISELTIYALAKLREIAGLKVIGPTEADSGASLISFVVEGTHAHDISAVLDSKGVAVRSGQHCAMPLHDKLGVSATARVSFYIYNTFSEIDYFIEALKEGLKILR